MLHLARLQSCCWPWLAMVWYLKTFGRPRIWPWIQAAWGPLEVRAASSWQVSSYGRLQRPNGTLTWGSRHASGYLRACIGRVQWSVHRLVVHAFHGPPRNPLAWQINHLDGNRSNNRLNNLQWVTPKQNMRHSYQALSRRTAGPKLSVAVKCRAVGSEAWTGYPSMTEAAKALGISIQLVSASCSRGAAVKGYEFQKERTDGDIEGEEWKQMVDPKTGYPIPGKMVSSLGRLKSKTGRISAGHTRKDGYCATSFRLGSKPRSRHVHTHQLVARAFLGPPPSPRYTQVNHKDGNKSNNSLGNLEYVTPAQNVAHSYWLTPTRTYNNVKPIESRPFRSSGQWRWHPSMTGAARELGVQRGGISHCLSGRRRQTGGYEFRCAPASQALPGEEWRDVDIPALLEERSTRETAGL